MHKRDDKFNAYYTQKNKTKSVTGRIKDNDEENDYQNEMGSVLLFCSVLCHPYTFTRFFGSILVLPSCRLTSYFLLIDSSWAPLYQIKIFNLLHNKYSFKWLTQMLIDI